MKNIVFSTTRQSNPGDEFILFGVLNLLKSLDIVFNPIIYNRHPDVVREERYFNSAFWKLCQLFYKAPRSRDNSFLATQANQFAGNIVDYVVFAGTPSWISRPSVPLLDYIYRHRVPYMFLGAGKVVAQRYLRKYPSVVANAEICSLRDRRTHEFARQHNPQALYLPCPALLSARKDQEKQITSVKKVGLVFACPVDRSHSSNNLITREDYEYMTALYTAVRAHFPNVEFEFVAHYIRELYGYADKAPIHYSYDARDYFDIYRQFDYVIGTRVHAGGIAASMGIPSTIIKHDLRGGTVEGFRSHAIESNTPISTVISYLEDTFGDKQIRQKNAELIDHKWKTMAEYQSLLKQNCSLFRPA